MSGPKFYKVGRRPWELKGRPDGDTELKYSGRVHSIRIPPHRIILSGCLLSFSDYTAAHFRYLGEGHQGHPVIDYRVAVTRSKKRSSSSERAMTAGITKMLRRFSMDTGAARANKASVTPPPPAHIFSDDYC